MPTVHQVLLPGEADSADSPTRLSITDDTCQLLPGGRDTSSRQSSAESRATMQATHDAGAAGQEVQFIDMNQVVDANEPAQIWENSCAGNLADDTSELGTHAGNVPERNNNGSNSSAEDTTDMQRPAYRGAKARLPSETDSESCANGHNVIAVEIKPTADDKAILAGSPNEKDGGDKAKHFTPTRAGDIARTLGKLFGCFLSGVVFGIAAEKGRVFETATIRGQFIYERWIMMKMFLSAAAMSCLCLALLSMLPMTRKAFEASRIAYVAGLTKKGVMSVVIGGVILGVGMVVAGSCPGMVLVQIGAWLSNGGGGMTFLGCMVAVYVYAALDPLFVRMLSPSKPYEKYLADRYVETCKIPFVVVALAIGLMLGLAVMTIELLVPWDTDLANPNVVGSWFFETLAWPPYVSGILIGALQLPIVIIVSDTMGGSSSYCTLGSQVLVTKRMESWLPYLANFKKGVENWWQVMYVAGAVVGACISAAASGSLASTPGVSLVSSFLGGFLIIFGARLAGGCTSGHGLSGMGVLSVLSFITVAAMFAGGTAFAFIFWAVSKASVLDYYTF